MSHTNETLHYHLPKYIGTDIINPLTDFNDANDVIDEALYDANQTAANAVEIAQGASGEVGSYDARIAAAETLANTAITKADNTMDMIADEFDPLKEGGYQIGDSVIYNQKLYTFINPHTGAWDAGDVKQGTITEAVEDTISEGEEAIRQEVQDALVEIAGQTEKVTATQKMIGEPFDPNKDGGYQTGDVVTYADKLYAFNSDHVGAWTGLDVDVINMVSYVNNKTNEFDSEIARIDGNVNDINGVLDKIAGKVVLSEEQFARTSATGLTWQKILQVLNEVINAYNNKPANAIDIIIDGVDIGSFSMVCEWSLYDIVNLHRSVNASTIGLSASGTTGTEYCRNLIFNHSQDLVAYYMTQYTVPASGTITGGFSDLGSVSDGTTITASYHYLYKIQ